MSEMQQKPARSPEKRGAVEWINDLTDGFRAAEAAIVGLVASLSPWLAPLAPAYIAYNNMVGKLEFSPAFALALAAAIEFLGVSAVYTALSFWQHNRQYHRPEHKVSFGFSLLPVGLYYAVVLTVNPLLEIPDGAVQPHVQQFFPVAAILLLSSLTIPAALVVAARALQAKILTDIRAQERDAERKAKEQAAQERQERALARERERQERAQAEAQAAQERLAVQLAEAQAREQAERLAAQERASTRDRLLAFYANNPKATQAEAAQAASITRQRVGQYLTEFERDGLIHRNGQIVVLDR